MGTLEEGELCHKAGLGPVDFSQNFPCAGRIRPEPVCLSFQGVKIAEASNQLGAPGPDRIGQILRRDLHSLEGLLLPDVLGLGKPLPRDTKPLPKCPDASAEGTARMMAMENPFIQVNAQGRAPAFRAGPLAAPVSRWDGARLLKQPAKVVLGQGIQKGISSSVISTLPSGGAEVLAAISWVVLTSLGVAGGHSRATSRPQSPSLLTSWKTESPALIWRG